jgi:hypothetical protein
MSVAFVLSYPANVFGSTVLVYLSPTEAIIASDSLANRIEGGPSRNVCKIVQVRGNMFFAATMTGVVDEPHFDPYGLARDIAALRPTPAEAAKEYARLALLPLQTIWNASRERYLQVSRQNDLRGPYGPQDYLFVGIDAAGYLSAAGASFVEANPASNKLKLDSLVEHHSKNENDVFLGRYGVFQDIPGDAEFQHLSQKIGNAEALKHFVQVQIKATPLVVGAPVVVLVIRRDGSFEWLTRGLCGDDPDGDDAEGGAGGGAE